MKQTHKPTPHQQAEHAFKQAHRAAKSGDQREADRWLKIAERTVAAARRLADLAEPEPEPDAEALRAELRDRVRRYIGVSDLIQAWERERDIRDAVAAFARTHNLPEPPDVGPCPYNEEHLEAVGAGWSNLDVAASPQDQPSRDDTPAAPHVSLRAL